MKNKVLVEIYITQLDEVYNIYLPLNKNIANIITLIGKSICELKRIDNFDYNSLSLYNRETTIKYNPNSILKETNIRNGFRLILM